MENLEKEVNNMKAISPPTKPVKVNTEILDELELFLNPTQNKYVKTNLTKFVSEAVKDKLEKEKRKLPMQKSA